MNSREFNAFNHLYVDAHYEHPEKGWGYHEVGVYSNMAQVEKAVENFKTYRVFVYGLARKGVPAGRKVFLFDDRGPGQK